MIWPDIFGFLRIYKNLQLQAFGICGRGYLGSDRILNPRVGETWISEKKIGKLEGVPRWAPYYIGKNGVK